MIETTPFPVECLLPLRGIAVTLRFLAPSRPYLFHQAPLAGFLRTLVADDAGSESPLVIDAPESGRVHYRAGDRYRFAVLAPSGGETALDALMKALVDLPFSATRRDDPLPFRNNLALVSMTDLFGSAHARVTSELRPYDLSALQAEAAVWAEAPGIVLRWLSPTRLLREKGQRTGTKGEARFCRDASQLDFALLQERVIDTLTPLAKTRRTDPGARPGFPAAAFTDADLFWIDGAYLDEFGREHQMGGMMGQLQLPTGGRPQPPTTDWAALTLGQYLGIGQRRSFGFGRYRLESLAGDFTCIRIGPATGILERVVDPDNLSDAFRHVRANARKEAPSRAHTEPETAWLADADEEAEAADAAEKIETLGARLATRRYQPSALRGVVITEADGDLRPLAIPPFWDRVAQRAVVQTIAPGIEPLMYHGSFGYRPGRSRHGASRMIERAFQAGFRWVFESDIDDFFDTVAWKRLETRLRALYADDPIVDLLLDWVAAPVVYQNQQVDRAAGLPQGSPVSPILANLMLDDFDSDLATAGFRLVRFADDFLILCKDRDQALAASQAARTSLRELGLEVNTDKTRVTHFDEGFRYLGYLFVGGLVLDVAGESRKDAQTGTNTAPPPNSWLAHLARRPVAPLTETGHFNPKGDRRKPSKSTQTEPAATPIAAGHAGDAGTLFVVTGRPATVRIRSGRVQAVRDEHVVVDAAIRTLSAVLLYGPHQVTTQALQAAFAHRLPVHFASAGGRYLGTAAAGIPGARGPAFWLGQERWLSQPEHALHAAREVVTARIRHQREVLRRHDTRLSEQIAQARESLSGLERSAVQAADLPKLNGEEGAAARVYFQALKALVPPWADFNGRNRQPPKDPFNALLSLGYSMLQARVSTSLRVAGLYPWGGFYHQSHGRHETLASDLMEPFRHLVERSALRGITGFGEADFQPWNDGVGLRDQPRREYLAALSARFEAPLQRQGTPEPAALEEHLHAQNRSLIRWIEGGQPFSACRFR